MVADGFTKLLPGQKHAAFVKQLELVNIKEILNVVDSMANKH